MDSLIVRDLFESLVQNSLIHGPNGSGSLDSSKMFCTIAERLLEVTSTNEVGFLCHVVDFLKQRNSEGCAQLWHQLRCSRDKFGCSPLHRAVIVGNQSGVKLLVSGYGIGMAKNSSCWNESHIFKFPEFDVLHARTLEGWTSVHLAAVAKDYPSPGIQKRSISDPAIPPGLTTEGNKEGEAREGECEDMLDVLMGLYKTVEKPDAEDWDFADNSWMTPLHYAVLANRQVHVKKLLTWECYSRHVNAGDFHRKTPLHMAVCHPELLPVTDDLQGHKQLHQIAHHSPPIPNSSLEVVKILAECANVDIQALDCCMYTPLHWAVHVGNVDAVRYLVSLRHGHKIRATKKDLEGRPAIEIAFQKHAALKKLRRPYQQNREYFNGGGNDNQQLHNFETNPEVFEEIQHMLMACDDVKEDLQKAYRDRQVYVEAANAILVGAALVASVTYQGWLQPPTSNGSRESDQEIRDFWYRNSLSFFFSVATVMAGVSTVFPARSQLYIGQSVRNVRRALVSTSALFIATACQVLLAFTHSGFASLDTSVPNLKRIMIMTTGVGLMVCLLTLVWFFICLERIAPGWGTRAMWLRTRLSALALDLAQLLKRTGKHRHLDLEIIKIKLKDAWRRSWSSNSHLSPGKEDAEQIEFVLAMVFEAEHGSSRILPHKLSKFDRQLWFLERVYENVRKEIAGPSVSMPNKRSLDNMRFLNGSGVMPREIHFCMQRCPLALCRTHSLKVDRERRKCITDRFDAHFRKYKKQ